MTNPIQITIGKEQFEVERGTTLQEISKLVQSNYDFEIILAKVDQEYKELSEKVISSSEISFFDLTSRVANKVYLNSLILLVSCAYKKLTGKELRVNHSLDRGLYITTEEPINEAFMSRLTEEMNRYVEKDISIDKLNVSRLNAIEYFTSRQEREKVANMKYNTNTFMTLYKLEDYYDYFYSLMVPSTRCLSHFALTYLNDHGFILRYPTIYDDKKIKEYVHRPNIYKLFQTSRAWAKQMGLEYAVDLNEEISASHIDEIIMIDEMKKNAELLEVARKISEEAKKKIVLIAGPSSSGKTTTCKKLSLCLKSCGKNPIMISMDDYFVERENTPLDEKGNPDFESLRALDLNLFNDTMDRLLKGEEVLAPRYNFLTGKKEFVRKLQMKADDILLIEGIHALNPEILDNIAKEQKTKIYLSALTELSVDKHNRISTTDNRLLRRIVRDNRTRGYNVEATLKNWASVRDGEEKYIFPYQDSADFTLNTAMIYEIGVLKVYAEPLLYSVDITSEYYHDAKRLINFLRIFLPISSELVPTDSVLREFIGGSPFK